MMQGRPASGGTSRHPLVPSIGRRSVENSGVATLHRWTGAVSAGLKRKPALRSERSSTADSMMISRRAPPQRCKNFQCHFYLERAGEASAISATYSERATEALPRGSLKYQLKAELNLA